MVALWPAEISAQHRVYRRAPARSHVFVGVGYGYPAFGYPYWPGYGYGFGIGYGFGFGYQYGPYPYPYPYPPYGYGYGYYDAGADLRTQVTPREAEVYVDGYLTGHVDNFDGIFQRLRVPLGEHEITIYKEGFRTIHQKMLFRPFESYSIRETMQPLAPGDPAEVRPTPVVRTPPQGPPPRRYGPPPGDRDADRYADRNADRFGAVAVRVQPADAEVFIDGERWETPAGEDRLLVELSEGTHRVEIRKAGFKPYNSTVTIRSGETVTLNVSLPSGG